MGTVISFLQMRTLRLTMLFNQFKIKYLLNVGADFSSRSHCFCRLYEFKWNFESLFLTDICSYNDKCYYVLWYCENSVLKLNNEVFVYILSLTCNLKKRLYFLTWTILKVFIEIVTVSFLVYVLVFWQRGMQVLNSLLRNWTCTPCIGSQSFNHWTPREVFAYILLYLLIIQKLHFCPES